MGGILIKKIDLLLKILKYIIKPLKYVAACGFIIGIMVLILNLIVINNANKFILEENSNIPQVEAIIIPGAYVSPSGKVSDILRDRLDTSLQVLAYNKDLKIIVTGDHGRESYDEVNAMRQYLESKGVSTENIFMDHAGFSTYESIYRAKEIFQVNSAIIVTQDYHLKRAVYIARKKGIEAYGIPADKRKYVDIEHYKVRESLARCKDFFLVNVIKSKPKFLGDKIPVMTSDSRLTHDKN